MANGTQDKDDQAPPSDSIDSSSPASDRRAGTRHLACFAAEIQMERWHGARTAVIRDLSVTGALLLTGARVQVGEQVTLNLYILGDDTQHTVTGRIVRHERRDPATAGLWPYSIGIHFDAPLDELEVQIKEVAARQAALLGRKEST
ncbi:MAG: PilZ domain-containing protein [Polyangiaceae bacterium]